MKRLYLPVVVALSVTTSGCFLGNNAKVKVPSPPSAAPAASQPAPPSESAAAETAPPAPPSPPASQTTPPPVEPSQPPAITPPPKPPVARTNPSLPSPPATPVPQLAEILTPAQRRQYQAEYAEDVARSNAALKQVVSAEKSGRRLSATERQTVMRIQTFLRQAEAAHNDDIATALQLSRRADLLAQELLKGLK